MTPEPFINSLVFHYYELSYSPFFLNFTGKCLHLGLPFLVLGSYHLLSSPTSSRCKRCCKRRCNECLLFCILFACIIICPSSNSFRGRSSGSSSIHGGSYNTLPSVLILNIAFPLFSNRYRKSFFLTKTFNHNFPQYLFVTSE
jgi:hypothetical protein